MVRINTIYQKVLAIANKEQRGYITPQEFNLFADQAQLDIFEQYFYDINQFALTEDVGIEYSNAIDTLEEKISIFDENIINQLNEKLKVIGFISVEIDKDGYKAGKINVISN